MRKVFTARTTLVAAALAGLLLATGCSSGSSDSGNGSPVKIQSDEHSIYRGTEVPDITKPDMVLTDTTGQPYDFRARTAGKVTLLYFGYTHCPDVCPTTMGDIAVAMTKLSPADRAQVNVVFVTTDPTHDSPQVERAWLNMMDPTFVGLTGSFDTIQAAARSVGVAVEPPSTAPDGTVTSTHGAQVIAFSPDGVGRVIYLTSTGLNADGSPNGITADDYAHDLPLLIHGAGGAK